MFDFNFRKIELYVHAESGIEHWNHVKVYRLDTWNLISILRCPKFKFWTEPQRQHFRCSFKDLTRIVTELCIKQKNHILLDV